MKVTVDRDLCSGHAMCAAAGPDVYVLDEFGYCSLAPGTPVPPEHESQALAGARACPERAIAVDDGTA
jgi:ferredoxin